jgi:hypothetical protein
METSRQLAELQRTFVAPSGLRESRPRDVQLTGGGRALMTVAVLMFAVAIGAFVGLSGEVRRQANDRRALLEHGVTVAGQVTRLWTSGDDRRRVNYRFVVDGRAYNDHTKVSNERRRTLQVGSEILVRYVPADPSINVLEGMTLGGGMPAVLPAVIAALIAAGGSLFLLGIRGQRRLLAEGRVAPAIVTAHHSHSTSHGGKHRSMTYEFPLLSGAVASGKSGTSAKPPAIGSVICVIYDPESPKRNKVYPLSLVTPAR